jgi:hypothetical protein
MTPMRRATEVVQWDAQPVSIQWTEPAGKDAPIAHLRLDTDSVAGLFVDIGQAPPVQRFPSESQVGALVFWSTMPVSSDLRREKYVRQHVARAGQLIWLHQPDAYGLVADAVGRLNAIAEAEERAVEERLRRQKELLHRLQMVEEESESLTKILAGFRPSRIPQQSTIHNSICSYSPPSQRHRNCCAAQLKGPESPQTFQTCCCCDRAGKQHVESHYLSAGSRRWVVTALDRRTSCPGKRAAAACATAGAPENTSGSAA